MVTQITSKARRSVASSRRAATDVIERLTRRLRKLTHRRSQPAKLNRRPDGTIVPPSPQLVVIKPAPTTLSKRLRAPFTPPIAAVRDRWNDAMREGRLAARDREVEIRADYERRVLHDARLHAAQHQRKQEPIKPE